MNAESFAELTSSPEILRRPRIGLMGEFSAGKSTLANLLLGQNLSPVKVTATQLPPVLYSYGPESVLRVDNAGQEIPIDAEALDAISHDDSMAVRVLLQAEVLEFCDLIDMPGTSDPNLPQAVWDRMLGLVDGVVWCTPSTQAWRQSEAALWEMVPDRLRDRSLLLITRIDKLANPTDRDRVVARVRRETEGLFNKVLPISLTEAIAAEDEPEALRRCGAETFVESLLELFERFGDLPEERAPLSFATLAPVASAPLSPHDRAPAAPAPQGSQKHVKPRRVMPRRVSRRPAVPG
jgi:hypothetical protein